MTYWVTFKIDARYTTVVEADSLAEALESAQDNYYDANLGECSDVDGYAISATDENDNIVWER